MITVKRDSHNPLITPNPNNIWESLAAFNGCPIRDDNRYIIVYRALSKKTQYKDKEIELSTIGVATSQDGVIFTDRYQLIKPEYDWEKYGCEDPRISKIDDDFFIFYTALSDSPPGPNSIKVAVALSKDCKTIQEKHLVTPFNAKAMAFFPEKINGQYVALLTPNTDIPPSKIAVAKFNTREEIWSERYWNEWYKNINTYTLPLQRYAADQVEVGAPPIKTQYGWLLIYSYIKNYLSGNEKVFNIEVVLLDSNNPEKIIGRVHGSLLKPEEEYELKGIVANIAFPSGAFVENDNLYIYYGGADTVVCRASLSLKELFSQTQINSIFPPKLKKYINNPILSPKQEHAWEATGVLNPAAIYLDNTVHLLYRAISSDNTSTVGYAKSKDGITFEERHIEPIYVPRSSFEDKKRVNNNSGCEDPRITLIDDKIYMCYTAFDSIGPPRVALTYINVNDFLEKRYIWSEPVLISPPGVDDKDACILPEKINGKYMIFHRIESDIVVDLVDSLDFNGNRWLRSLEYIPLREDFWDNDKVGISAPPIKSEYGWLLLYHGISATDHVYRVGAMLLDLENPSYVLARSHYPILEPELPFEKDGNVNNVVFPCGAVVIDKKLFVYYGGADKYIGVATIGFHDLLAYLNDSREKKFLI